MSPDEKITFRLARDKDAQGICSILFKAFEEFRPLYSPKAFEATVLNAEKVKNRIAEGPIWVAECGEKLIGTVSGVIAENDLYVRGMAILPEWRGKKIGYELLTRVEQFALGSRCKKLFLSTTPFLNQAVRLYESFGFQKSDLGPNDLFGTPLFSMEKKFDFSLLIEKIENSKSPEKSVVS